MSDLYAVRSGKLKLKGEKVESKDEKKKKEKKRKREKKEQEESKRQKTLEASDTQRFVFEETRHGLHSQNYLRNFHDQILEKVPCISSAMS
jgi:FAM32A